MSRLQKKCLIGSVALHLLLLVIVLVSPAFLLKEDPPVDIQVLEFIPDKAVDEALAQPKAQTQELPEPQPEPTPVPVQEPKPEPPKKVEPKPDIKPTPKPKKEIEPEPKKVEPKPPEPTKPDPLPPKEPPKKEPVYNKPKDIVVNLKPVSKTSTQPKVTPPKVDTRKNDIANTLKQLRSSTSNLKIESINLGTAGVSYASYDAIVKQRYTSSWNPTVDLDSGSNTVKVKIIVLRDGTVKQANIIGKSGNASLDADVQRLINRITTIGRPFPDGAKESQREYIINFNLKDLLNG